MNRVDCAFHSFHRIAVRADRSLSLIRDFFKSPEWLMECASEVHEMSRILGITLSVKLSTVVTEGKQPKATTQCLWTTREGTGFASQASQIMAEFSIICSNRVGVGLAFRDFIATKVIPKMSIRIKTIRVIPFGFGCFIHQLLNHFLSSLPNDRPAQQAAGCTIFKRKDINTAFCRQ